MKVFAFDLGDTLVEYEGLPPSWVEHYPEALGELAEFLGVAASVDQIAKAGAVLGRFNTRIHPRAEEVAFAAILKALLPCFGEPMARGEIACARAFFRIFRQRLRCFPDTVPALQALRRNCARIGVFTDVPYGMPRQLVLEDVREAGLEDAFDVFMTSRDVGFRKPSVATLRALASKLGCTAAEMIYIGNEQKDIDVARAFGCSSILLDRQSHGNNWGQGRTITSLTEL